MVRGVKNFTYAHMLPMKNLARQRMRGYRLKSVQDGFIVSQGPIGSSDVEKALIILDRFAG